MNAYVWNLKNGTDGLICKAKVETHREQTYGY